jgi:hypothetical protein
LTVLSREEQTLIVAFRRHTALPLDDGLYALQATIPHLTRSSLHRLFQRQGISRLPTSSEGTTDFSSRRLKAAGRSRRFNGCWWIIAPPGAHAFDLACAQLGIDIASRSLTTRGRTLRSNG